MKYLIAGTGGVGGSIAGFLSLAGKDVTCIARGAHLQAIQKDGLKLKSDLKGEHTLVIPTMNAEEFNGKADVIFVCVKGYSLEDTIPFIQRVAKPSTIVIPVLNIYGTGAKMQEQLPKLLVTDGCIYVSANIKEPGVLIQHGRILRVVYGVRNMSTQKVNIKRAHEEMLDALKNIKKDFDDSGIDGVLSENIQRDALEKFSYVSPIGAAGLYYHATAADFQREGKQREAFKTMIREIAALAEAMGVPFERDMVEVNLKILSSLAPEATTSMQRDVMEGKDSEIDGLVYEVVRMGERYHVPVPMYAKVAEKLRENL